MREHEHTRKGAAAAAKLVTYIKKSKSEKLTHSYEQRHHDGKHFDGVEKQFHWQFE